MSRINPFRVRYNTGVTTKKKDHLPIVGNVIPSKWFTYFEESESAQITVSGLSSSYYGFNKTRAYKASSCFYATSNPSAFPVTTLEYTPTAPMDFTSLGEAIDRNYAHVIKHGVGSTDDKNNLHMVINYLGSSGLYLSLMVFSGDKYAVTSDVPDYKPALHRTNPGAWRKATFKLGTPDWAYFADFTDDDWNNITKVRFIFNGGVGDYIYLHGFGVAVPPANQGIASPDFTVTGAYYPSITEANSIFVSEIFGNDANAGTNRSIPVKTLWAARNLITASRSWIVIMDSETYSVINDTTLIPGMTMFPTQNNNIVADYLEIPSISHRAGVNTSVRIGARSSFRNEFYSTTGGAGTVRTVGTGGTYATIGAAVTAATAGDCIQIIDNAVYAESVSTTKALVYEAAVGKTPIWSKGGSAYMLTTTAASTIRGITFKGTTDTDGIIASAAINVIDCTFSGFTTSSSTRYACILLNSGAVGSNIYNNSFFNISAYMDGVRMNSMVGPGYVLFKNNLMNVFSASDVRIVHLIQATAVSNITLKAFNNSLNCNNINTRLIFVIPAGATAATSVVGVSAMFNYTNGSLYYYSSSTACGTHAISLYNNLIELDSHYSLSIGSSAVPQGIYLGNYVPGAASTFIAKYNIFQYIGDREQVVASSPNGIIFVPTALADYGNFTFYIDYNIFKDLYALSVTPAVYFGSGITIGGSASAYAGELLNNIFVNCYTGIVTAGKLFGSIGYNIFYENYLGINNTGASITFAYNLYYGNITNRTGTITDNNAQAVDPGFVEPETLNFGWIFNSFVENNPNYTNFASTNAIFTSAAASNISSTFMFLHILDYKNAVIGKFNGYMNFQYCGIHGFAVALWFTAYGSYVKNCDFTEAATCIRINTSDFETKITAYNNTFYGCANPILVKTSADIQYNTILDSDYGLVVDMLGVDKIEDYISNFLTVKNNIIWDSAVTDYTGNKQTDYCIIGSRDNENSAGDNDINSSPMITEEYYPCTVFEGFRKNSPAYLASSDPTKHIGAKDMNLVQSVLSYNSYTFGYVGTVSPSDGFYALENPTEHKHNLVPLNVNEVNTVSGSYLANPTAYRKEFDLVWGSPGKDSKIGDTLKLVIEYMIQTYWVVGISTDNGSTYTYYKVKKDSLSLEQQRNLYTELPWGSGKLKLILEPNFDINNYLVDSL